MSRKNETHDQGRRSFLGAATLTMGAAQLGLISATEGGSARAKSSLAVGSSDAPQAFAALKQIDAGVLEVGYAEVGPSNGFPVIPPLSAHQHNSMSTRVDPARSDRLNADEEITTDNIDFFDASPTV
jgi:hypothetical protein